MKKRGEKAQLNIEITWRLITLAVFAYSRDLCKNFQEISLYCIILMKVKNVFIPGTPGILSQ